MISTLNCSVPRKLTVRVQMFCELLLIKVLYEIAIAVMLSNFDGLWTYNKSVDFIYFPFELILFFICAHVYLKGYSRGQLWDVVSTILFILFYIPANSGLVLSANSMGYYILINMYSILLFYFLTYLSQKEHINDIITKNQIIYNDSKKRKLYRVINSAIYILCSIILLQAYLYNGIDLSFSHSMYDARAMYSTYRKGMEGTILSYVFLLLDGTVRWCLPIALYYAIRNKKKTTILICLLSYLVIFSVNMEKTTAIIPMVVCFICWAEKHTDFNKICELLVRMFVFILVCVFIEYMLFGSKHIFMIFVRRLLYIPTYSIDIQYGFFSANPKLWFTDDVFLIEKIVRKIKAPAYPLIGITHIISERCYNNYLPSPNAGLFAEAYAQLGALGAFVFPFIVGTMFKIVYEKMNFLDDGAIALTIIIFGMTVLSVPVLDNGIPLSILIFICILHVLRKAYNLECKVGKRKCLRLSKRTY